MNQITLFDPPKHDEDPEELPDFSKMTREEIKNWKLSRMIKDLEDLEANPDAAALSWHNVLKEDISVMEAISANFGLGKYPGGNKGAYNYCCHHQHC